MTKDASTGVAKLDRRGVELMDQLGIRLSDPDGMQWEIAERLALANTAEELFNPNGALGWSQQMDRRVIVRRVRWLPSDMDGGAGFYALVDAVDADSGEALVLTSGSFNVLVQLARAEQLGILNDPVKLVESDRPTADGYRPQRLVQA
jgi:hypothetical protein